MQDFLKAPDPVERIKKHAGVMASQAGRPYQYLSEPTRKEDLARKINVYWEF